MSDRDRAFDTWVADARGVRIVDELQRRGAYAALRRSGAELAGPCPRCGGRDRFAVHPGKNVFNCRGCGTGGGPIDLVELVDGASFLLACEILTGAPPPAREGGESDAERVARLDRLAVAAAERKAAEAERAQAEASFREKERSRAHAFWRDGKPLPGTPAEAYLALRGVTLPPGAQLRFLPHHALWSGPPPKGRVLHRGPAMIGGMVGPDGRFAGIHSTWIDLGQSKGKALVVDGETGEVVEAKKVRGSMTGATILLAPCPGGRQPKMLFLGEGIETVLSVRQALVARGCSVVDEAEFRSAVSLGNLSGRAKGRVAHPTETITDKRGRTRRRLVPDSEPLPGDPAPVVAIGATITDVVLLGDGDSDPFVTHLALVRAAARLARAYPWISVALAMATEGMDFNDMLRARPEAEWKADVARWEADLRDLNGMPPAESESDEVAA